MAERVSARCDCGRILPPYNGTEYPGEVADRRAWMEAYVKRVTRKRRAKEKGDE